MVEKNLMKHHYLKKSSYGLLNVEHITYADYGHAKRFCKDFQI